MALVLQPLGSAGPGGYQCGLRKKAETVGERGRQAVPSKLFLLPFLFFNLIFFFIQGLQS